MMSIESISHLDRDEQALTTELVTEFRTAFRLFSKNGRISIHDLGIIMRAIGHDPTDEEIQKLIEEADGDESGIIRFSEFLNIMKKQIASTDTSAEIRESFQVLDKDKRGYLSVEKFREIMRNHGDHLTKAEVDVLIKDVDPQETGRINCEDFLRMVAS